MAPYEGVAVIESERIEQNAEELEKNFRCTCAGQLLNEPGPHLLCRQFSCDAACVPWTGYQTHLRSTAAPHTHILPCPPPARFSP